MPDNIIMFTPDNMSELALFAYEGFLNMGPGVVYITPDPNAEHGYTPEYVVEGEVANLATDSIASYKPEDEIIFVIRQADGSLGSTIQRFHGKSFTPKYYYDLKTAI
jgi:hypothetical protein